MIVSLFKCLECYRQNWQFKVLGHNDEVPNKNENNWDNKEQTR